MAFAQFLAAAILFAQGEPLFEPMQPELFAAGGSMANAWADYDKDGDLDLYVGFNGAPGRLYRNDRGRFADVGASAGVGVTRDVRAAAWGDYDGDGDADLLVGYAPGAASVLKLYRNDKGRFEDVTPSAGIARDAGAARQLSFVDVDADGDLDLFVAFRDQPNALFRNEGGRFSDVAPEIGLADKRKTVGGVWFDYDEDGDLDLYAANMDGDANALFQNDGGKFTDVAGERGLAWGGRPPRDPASGTVRPCAEDVDNDGRLDIVTANYGPSGLFLARGGGRFEDRSAQSGLAVDGRYDSCAFADFDNDGQLDVYVNGTVTGGVSYRDYLFRQSAGRFTDVTPHSIKNLHADHGVQWADFDGDGDLDLALTGSRPDGKHALLRNMQPAATASRSVSVRVLDTHGLATRAGAVVRLFDARSGRLLGSRLVDSGSGYDAQSETPVHFGLAAMGRVNIVVTFPAAGRSIVREIRNVDPGARRVVEVRL